MAKPILDSPGRRRRRRRRITQSRRPLSGPSSGLLSLLATIAASSTVDGTPLIAHRNPPHFLCPSLEFEGDIPPDAVLIYRPQVPSQDTPGPPLPKRNIPDKYTQGPDGRWRKAEYIIDGTTICPLPGSEPTPAIDEASPPSSYMPPPTTSSNQFIDTLPNGWKPTIKPASSHTTLILGLSLGLALFICFFITGCVLWRKNKARSKDEEETVQKRRDKLRDDQENLIEKEARVNQKIWARATARWKFHARYSAQQRRGKRTGHRVVLAHSSSVSASDPLTLSEDHVLTRPSSPYPPVPIREAAVQLRVPSHSKYSTSLSGISTPQIVLPYSPPAYRSRGAQIPSIAADPSQTNSSKPSLSTCFGQSSVSMATHPHSRSSSSSDRLPYIPPYEEGHVAVDDKELLARLADLTSAPPLVEGHTSGATDLPDAQVSAPEWQDEELEDFGETSHRSSVEPIISHHSVLPFPPPPPFKKKAGVTALCDYPHPLENLTSEYKQSLEGGFPSAPPLEGTDVLPSAPPLLDCEHHDNVDSSEDTPVQSPVGTLPCYFP